MRAIKVLTAFSLMCVKRYDVYEDDIKHDNVERMKIINQVL
ncbi:hypothetical protein [Proteus hauseri]|uniref:Uncharacterized protein n=1 Tax=Proteus hauseri ATCC 700826 TaxID=1354271 RepID=A0AAJ3LTK9_PROHU|nr:hypothetical protein [Proteus hauseri]OAT46706.1 hypothetical protein M997_2188 [Proteus hauseri ATCC 700826]